jgi:acetylglutamate kinase
LSLLKENIDEIIKHKSNIFVIKYGGSAMTVSGLKQSFAEDVCILKNSGIRLVIVHGGGKEITNLSNKLNVPVKFIDGLRCTDKPSMEIVQMVLAGKINKEIVSGLNKFNGNAVGISGIDGDLLKVKKLTTGEHDLGFVGEIQEINVNFINLLLSNNYIPVIAPIGFNDAHESFNINADDAASALACALKAEKLIYVSDVSGIMNNGRIIQSINFEKATKLIENDVIINGMIPKVKSAFKSLNSGVKTIHIVDGRTEHSVINGVFSHKKHGTEIHNAKNTENEKHFLKQTY